MNGEPCTSSRLLSRTGSNEPEDYWSSNDGHEVLAALSRGSCECEPSVASESDGNGKVVSDRRDELSDIVSPAGSLSSVDVRENNKGGVDQQFADRDIRMDTGRFVLGDQRSDDREYDSDGGEPHGPSEGRHRDADHVCDFSCGERGDHDAVLPGRDLRTDCLTTKQLEPRLWPRLKGTLLENVWPRLNKSQDRVMVVERSGKIVGCFAFTRAWHAECAWIDPSERGRVSVPRALMRSFLRTANSLRAKEVLMMATNSESEKLCARLGHQSIRMECSHYAVQTVPMEM